MDLTFLHCADLHLDSPFQGLARLDPSLAARCRQAARNAWGNLLHLAVERAVDFVLIAGDVYDGSERSLRAQLDFQAGLQHLADRGIRSYVIHGNHDPLDGRLATLRPPEGVTVFPGSSVTSVVHCREGRPVARIHGISYPSRTVPPGFAEGYAGIGDGLLEIGLFHGTVGPAGEHEVYAQRSVAELAQARLDYWALGHIHQPGVLQAHRPTVVYAGNLQGRHVREAGPRGCWIVEARDRDIASCEFVALDDLRWATAQVDLGGAESVDEVRLLLMARCQDLRREADGRPVLARLRLVGRTSLAREVRRGLPELTAVLREEQGQGPDLVWVERLECALRPALDLCQRAEDPDLVGELVRQRRAFSAAEARAALEELWSKPQAQGVLAPVPDEQVEELLDEALALAADHLEEG